MKEIDWKLSQVAPICQWSYIVCKQAGVDLALQQELKTLALQRADAIVKDTEAPAYRVGRGAAERGNGWGNLNGGGRWADPCLRAYFLTRDRKYLDAACLNADFQLGANPLSRTFLTGLGDALSRTSGDQRIPLHPPASHRQHRQRHHRLRPDQRRASMVSDHPLLAPLARPGQRRGRSQQRVHHHRNDRRFGDALQRAVCAGTRSSLIGGGTGGSLHRPTRRQSDLTSRSFR